MRCPLAAGLLLAITWAAPALGDIRAEQERLCTGDAFRLCSAEIPNEERITACMARQRKLLTPECRAVFDLTDSPANQQASRTKPRKPLQLGPQ